MEFCSKHDCVTGMKNPAAKFKKTVMVQNAETSISCSKYGDFMLEYHAKYIKVSYMLKCRMLMCVLKGGNIHACSNSEFTTWLLYTDNSQTAEDSD